jgi:hypothetical protein
MARAVRGADLTPIAIATGGWVAFGIVYLVLLVTLGIISLRKGHWIMFILGLFLPLFWLIGALIPSRRAA